MMFPRASKVRIRSLTVAEIMVGMNPTGRWSVATHLIDGSSYVCPHCQALLVAYLDRRSHSLAIFGALTVIFFILLLRIPRPR